MTESDQIVLGVQSDVSFDGAYIVTVSYGPDLTFTLDRDNAVRYTTMAFAAAMRATHDSAVIRQLHQKLGIDLGKAAATLQQLRRDRVDRTSTAPVTFTGSVSVTSFEPLVVVSVNGEPAGQAHPDSVQEHAWSVLMACEAVELDAAYFRLLTGLNGVGEATARATVGDLATFLK